jgi:hypothetical protein
MEDSIPIQSANGVEVGTIVFGANLERLGVRKTASGADIEFPMVINLGFNSTVDPQPLLTDVHAQITGVSEQRTMLPLGRGRCVGWFMGAMPSASISTNLVWEAPLTALAAYEKFRDVEPPRFQFAVLAELAFLLPASGSQIRTGPHQVYGEVEVTYPAEVWTKATRNSGVSQAVFLEIPLPASPPGPWDAVWRSIGEAAVAFERGGETGRKGAILAIRQALDEWRKIEGEREDLGPGWKAPSMEDRNARTARQRLDALRYHLREYANLAAHSEATGWSREDASLLLATISALLAIRKP